MGINTGILTNALPLSNDQVKELERKALETGELFAYLNENSELCFIGVNSPETVRTLAWNNAYEILSRPEGLVRNEYKKDSLETFFLRRISTKATINDTWVTEGAEDEGTSGSLLYHTPYATFIPEEGYGIGISFMPDNTALLFYTGGGHIEHVSYTLDGNNLSIGIAEDEFVPAQLSEDGKTIQVTALGMTFTSEQDYFALDDDYLYTIDDDLSCFVVTPIDKTKAEYGPIKSNINGYEVAELTSGAFMSDERNGDNTTLISFPALPETITAVPEYVCCDCINLTEIDLPNHITLIERAAFKGCTGLMSVELPENLKRIDSYAFKECTSLTSISLPAGVETIWGEAFSDCTSLVNIELNDRVEFINSYHFAGCSSLTTITLPNNMTKIPDYMFKECTALSDIVIPVNVVTIGEGAFKDCTSLVSVIMPNSLTAISYYAFNNCSALTSIVIPSSVTTLDRGAFNGCSSLKSITYEGTKQQLESIFLTNGGLDDKFVGAPVQYIQCSDGKYYLPGYSEAVPTETLEGDGQEFHTLVPTILSFRSQKPLDEFQEVKVNGQVVDPANYTLEEGSTIVNLSVDYLNTLDIGAHNIEVVSKNSAAGGMFTVTSPAKNEYGFYYNQPYATNVAAFGGWLGLLFEPGDRVKLAYLDGTILYATYSINGDTITLTTNEGNVFTGIIHEDGESIYSSALGATFIIGTDYFVADSDFLYVYLEEIEGYLVNVIDKTKATYGAIKTNINGHDTVLLYSDAFVLSDGQNASLLSIPEMPASITMIGHKAFSGCTSLESVKLSDSILLVGAEVFSHCTGLAYAEIGRNVLYLGNDVFKGCTALTSLTIPFIGAESDGTASTRLDYLFGVNNVPASLKDIIITKPCTKIGDYAFHYCTNITNITIPVSVTEISKTAFLVTSSLNTVNYEGTIAQWQAINCYNTPLETLFKDTQVTYIQCSDGKLYFDVSSEGTPVGTLEGDGQEYYTLAPTALSFRSQEPLDEFQEVQINGQTIDPANYTLEEGSTIVKLSANYLNTLNVGTYDIKIVSKSNAPSGTFTVAAPEKNIHGFYYNQPYVANIPAFGGWMAMFFREDSDVEFVFLNGKTETAGYTVEGNNITVLAAAGTFTGYPTNNGYGLHVNELATTFTLGHDLITADEDYVYVFTEDLVGYVAYVINKSKPHYGAIKTGINSFDTVALVHNAFSYGNKQDGSAIINPDILTMPKLPKTITQIPSSAFNGCTSLQSVDIADHITYIGGFAFRGCYGLTEVHLPDSVVEIDSGAFTECENLESIHLGNGLVKLGNGALTKCYVLSDLILPDSLQTLDDWSLAYCYNLKSIIIPDGITALNDYVFCNSGLETIELGNNITSIGNAAFSYCKKLTSITLPNSVRTIGYRAFESCEALKSIDIPESVTSIGENAFQSCLALRSITLPSSLTSIDARWFYFSKSLANISYTGTVAQWQACQVMSHDFWNTLHLQAYYIQCSDGRIYFDGRIEMN